MLDHNQYDRPAYDPRELRTASSLNAQGPGLGALGQAKMLATETRPVLEYEQHLARLHAALNALDAAVLEFNVRLTPVLVELSEPQRERLQLDVSAAPPPSSPLTHRLASACDQAIEILEKAIHIHRRIRL